MSTRAPRNRNFVGDGKTVVSNGGDVKIKEESYIKAIANRFRWGKRKRDSYVEFRKQGLNINQAIEIVELFQGDLDKWAQALLAKQASESPTQTVSQAQQPVT